MCLFNGRFVFQLGDINKDKNLINILKKELTDAKEMIDALQNEWDINLIPSLTFNREQSQFLCEWRRHYKYFLALYHNTDRAINASRFVSLTSNCSAQLFF